MNLMPLKSDVPCTRPLPKFTWDNVMCVKVLLLLQHSAMWIHVTLVRCLHLNQEDLSSSPVGFQQKPSRNDRTNAKPKHQANRGEIHTHDRWNCVGTWSTRARMHRSASLNQICTGARALKHDVWLQCEQHDDSQRWAGGFCCEKHVAKQCETVKHNVTSRASHKCGWCEHAKPGVP